MSRWDFENNIMPSLTPEFRKEFTVKVSGKDAVKASGLVSLGHEKGYKSLTTKILQFPNNENGNVCITEALLVGYGWSPITNKIEEVTFSSIGDASPKNTGSMVAAHYIRMAETRAIGRVLRLYTNIGMVCADEIGDITEEPKITDKQLNYIGSLAKALKFNKETGEMNKLLDELNIQNKQVKTLTNTEAKLVIEKLLIMKEESEKNA
jgi:hypothetical protein